MRTKRSLTIVGLLVVAWTSYEIWSWGRPVPLKTRMLGREAANGGKKIRWVLNNDQDGKADITQADTDGDGRVDQLEFGVPAVRVIDLGTQENRGSLRRKLAVCLDGVPFAQMAELWDEGYFREFSRPTRMVSTFPSLSDVALTSVLNAGKVPGYENLYFDVKQNRLGGGPFSTLSKARIPYLEILDYDEPGIFKGMAYILPVKTFRADLGRFLKRYQVNSKLKFTSHLCSTDALCHVRSRDQFRPYLLEVDALLREIFMSCQGQLDFIVFSDHGNSQVDSRQLDIQSLLKRHGFRLESSLNDENSVVVPAFGLVGAIAVYCDPLEAPRLAEILAHSEGMDFCAYLSGSVARVVSSQGTATIEKDTYGKLRFVNEAGDFLQMSAILRDMKNRGQMDSNGFASPSDWFLATADHDYPNAVNALYEGVTNHVLNPANILVSLKDGYHYGKPFFNRLVTLRSTHGSLYTTQMTGFVMKNGPPQTRTIHSHEVLRSF